MYALEIIVRVLMLFAVLVLLVRVLGKRQRQNLSPMQQMLMIALGSAAGDVMLYPQISIAYAATVLLGVALLTFLTEKAANRVGPLRDYLESQPRILVRDGVVDFDALKKERATEHELYASLRRSGAVALCQVDPAVLEVTGPISVILNEAKPKHRDLVEPLLHGLTPPSPRT